jgi:hypothetical protein
MVGNTVLFETSGAFLPNFALSTSYGQKDLLPAQISYALGLMDQEAGSLVLQGALALEAGQNRKAGACFRRALAFWNSWTDAAAGDPRSQAGRQMAQFFLRLLEKANPDEGGRGLERK